MNTSTPWRPRLYHRMTPKEALDRANAIVQRGLDRVLTPTAGTPIRSWSFFYITYGIILLAVGIVVYLWDTHRDFRRKLARRIGLSKQADNVIEGSSGGYFRTQWWGGYIARIAMAARLHRLRRRADALFAADQLLLTTTSSTRPSFTGLENYKLMFTDDRLVPIASPTRST